MVIEAGWRSGSLNTAHHAADLGRPIGAVPGPVTSAASVGCHKLLRESLAICVTGPDDMAELVSTDSSAAARAASAPITVGPVSDAKSSAPISQAIDPTGTRVRLLDALSDKSGRSVARISQFSGLAADRVRAELGLLELEGIVHERPSGWMKLSLKQLEARR